MTRYDPERLEALLGFDDGRPTLKIPPSGRQPTSIETAPTTHDPLNLEF